MNKYKEKIASNFEDIYGLILEKSGIDLFEEKRKDLKFDFRMATDASTGHKLKIVYSLDGIEMDIPEELQGKGVHKKSLDKYGKFDSETLAKNIKKDGNLDHSSKGQKVLAIIDTVTGKRLTKADCTGPFYGDSNSVHIEVGKIDNTFSFKSTFWPKHRDSSSFPDLANRENIGIGRGTKIHNVSDELEFDYVSDNIYSYTQDKEIIYKLKRLNDAIDLYSKNITSDSVDKNNRSNQDKLKVCKDLRKKLLRQVLRDSNKENLNESVLNEITESLDWINAFTNDEEFRENTYNIMIELDNPNSLMIWMKSNIKYGYRSIDDNKLHDPSEDAQYFSNNYRLQSPTQISQSKVGICWDQVELQRRWFEKHGIEHGIFYIELQGQEVTPTHTFLIYHMHDKYWWFEHSWVNMKCIRDYKDLRSALLDVILNYQKECNDNTSPIYVSWLKETPQYGISCDQYIQYAHSQPQLDVNNLPNSFYESYIKEDAEESDPPPMPGEESEETTEKPVDAKTAEEPSESLNDHSELPTDEEVGELDSNQEAPINDEIPEDIVEEPVKEEPPKEEPKEPVKEDKKPKEESFPKQTDRAESDRNGVRRKKLYIAFIEWCKEYNSKNTFGSIFDKDIFHVTYPFVPEEMRYFYRLANPILCVLAADLTFFPVSELRKINSKNSHLDEMMIFAATPNDLRVFNKKDKKVYRATEENGEIKLAEMINDTFDNYIQKMIDKGDILNGPIEESVDYSILW